jgi:uncharacterized protein YyaL (SSP411 family)
MHLFLIRRFWLVLFLPVIMGFSSCRRSGGDDEAQMGPGIKLAPQLQSNSLSAYPGALFKNQVSSPIRWQPWTKETIDKAKEANRLLFCVVTLPQQVNFQAAMDSLVEDSSVVAAINNQYVPVLIDGDASREMGLLVPDLCAQIDRPVQLPLFMWMTHECNPVAWIPVQANELENAAELFGKSHEMISQMWRDSSEYVLKNSASDNETRRQNFRERKLNKVASKDPEKDSIRCIRQLASLYDPLSRNLDEFGGLFPASSLELFAISARHPGVPEDLRQKCLEPTRGLIGDLLPSAMFDPLDGGIFVSRIARSWALPNFSFDCPAQARAVVALLEVYRTTGDKRALERALDGIKFAEKNFSTTDGLFAIGLAEPQEKEKWMWTVEEVEKILGAEDAVWWIKATGMEKLGNLPSEDDPRRAYFRKNTIGMKMTVEEIAADLSLAPEEFRPRFEAAKAKLLAVRDARMEGQRRDDCAHAGSTFRMVSAYAAAFAASGDEVYRDKAVALLKRAREAFAIGPRLRMFNKEAPDSIGAGRAFLYALCLQSVLDVAAVTLDDSWLVWSEDLATTLAELFIGDSFLKECPDSASLINLPITDLAMIFDDSTCGLLSMAEGRLAELGRPLVAKLSELATPLPQYAIERPVMHTDLILATIARHLKVSVIVGEGVQGDLLRAVQELTPRVIQRRMARSEEAVPAGTVKIIFANGTQKSASTAEALRQGVLSAEPN